MTCSKVALALSVLGTVGAGVIISIPKPPVAAILVGLLAQLSGRHRAVGARLRLPG